MSTESKSPLRRARWLIAALVGLAAIQLGMIVRLLQLPESIVEISALPIIAQIIINGVWIMAFSWAIIDLWRGHVESVKRALLLLIVFMIYSVLRLLIFAQADYDDQRLPFLIVITTVIVVSIGAVYGIGKYGHKANGKQKTENQTHDDTV